jgi:hypothetical protein
MELISYYNDPEGFNKPKLSAEDVEKKRDGIREALNKLRGDKD